MPAAPSPSYQFKKISQELYNKNVALVNANNTLELLQLLYQTIIDTQSLEAISHRFISTIVEKLGFSDGVVLTKSTDQKSLKIIGLTDGEVNRAILEMSGLPTLQVQIPIKNKTSGLVTSYLTNKKATGSLADLWSPVIKPSDLSALDTRLGKRTVVIYPIVTSDGTWGNFGVVKSGAMATSTAFEEKALERVAAVFGLAIDRAITLYKLRETEKRELEKAKEVIELKDQFVFIATHDLKTPVTAIDGFLKLIQQSKEKFSSDTQDNFNAILEASGRLQQLVEDLLEVARSESGTIKVEVAPVDPVAKIKKVVKEVGPSAAVGEVTLETKFDKATPQIMADGDKLAEIMENLLSNAIKFSPKGGKVIVVTRVIDGFMHISVADNGSGIPKGQQAKIFTRFFKARTSKTSHIPGTGLGLFVVRMLVEKMGGKINFVSQEGKGTTFTFSIPLVSKASRPTKGKKKEEVIKNGK